MPTPPRKLESQVRHEIRKRVTFADTGGVEIGVIPAGSHVCPINVSVETAFTGGTPVVTIGTDAVPDAFARSNQVIPGTAGYKPGLANTGQGNVTQDTVVKAFVSGGATAGLVDILGGFYPHMT